MKNLKLSNQAKKALNDKHENFFKYFWSSRANKIIENSPCLNEVDDIYQLHQTIDLVIPRFIDVLAKHPLLRHIDIRSLYYHDYEFTQSALNREVKIYNLTQAAKDMMVSEKFLRKGLRIGYFSGKKLNGKWKIDEIDHGTNWNLLPYLG